MRRLLLCLFVLAVSIVSLAQTVNTTSDGWNYTVSDNKATITGTTLTSGDLNIPSTVNEIPVTAIGYRAFYEHYGFTGSLTIPQGIITIGDSAFNGCSGLTGALTIPESVTTIGHSAFRNCSGLTGELKIPEGVTTIESSAFDGCSGLTGELKIPEGVTTIESSAFWNCSGLTGSLTIPEGVTTIGYSAFYNCSGLTGALTIPQSVTKIDHNAFWGCSGLTGELKIPQSVTTIGSSAFKNCSSLTGALTIPQSVTTIGEKAFQGCSGLSSVTFAASRNIKFGNNLFLDCSGLRYIDASGLPLLVARRATVATVFSKKDYTLVYFPERVPSANAATENVVIGNVCRNFKLYEATSSTGFGAKGYGQSGYEYGNAIIKNFTAASAVYTGKSLTDDGVYTLYLPYKINLPAEIEAYTLSKYSNKTAIFTKHTGDTLQAYTPYLLKRVGSATQTLDNTTMSNVAVTVAPNHLTNPNAGTAIDANTGTWKFLGTTNPISNADAETNRLYVLEADNTWRPVKSANPGGHVRSLRAFLQAPADYSGAPVAFMLDEGDTTTGLETIEAEVKKENVDIYTIEGRFVGRNYESLPSGLYIIGGKKVYKF